MKNKISKELAKHRLEQAKTDLKESKILYNSKFVADKQKTLEQINVAKEMIDLVEEYIENYH